MINWYFVLHFCLFYLVGRNITIQGYIFKIIFGLSMRDYSMFHMLWILQLIIDNILLWILNLSLAQLIHINSFFPELRINFLEYYIISLLRKSILNYEIIDKLMHIGWILNR